MLAKRLLQQLKHFNILSWRITFNRTRGDHPFCSRPGGAGKNPGAHQRGPTGGERQRCPHGAQAQHRPRRRSQAASRRLGGDGDRPTNADREIHRLQYPEHIKRYASANLTRSFNPWDKSTLKLLLDLNILECCC